MIINSTDVIYQDSFNLQPYKFFLKITSPEIAQHLEKLKLHAKGMFEREFWEDLAISTTFPKLKKISLKENTNFNPFNLKFFKNTSIQTLDLRDTKVNDLEYIRPFLQQNMRVLIGNNKQNDTLIMALEHAEKHLDYSYANLAITSGSWSKKNEEKIAKIMLGIAQQRVHWSSMQEWVEQLLLPEKISKLILETLNIIKHPLITFESTDMGSTHNEVQISYPFALSLPPFKAIMENSLGASKTSKIQLKLSYSALGAIEHRELSKKFPEGLGFDTIMEIASLADMYFWHEIKEDLITYIEDEFQHACLSEYIENYNDFNSIEKLDIILNQFLQTIPGFIKKPFVKKIINQLNLDFISVVKDKIIIVLKDRELQAICYNIMKNIPHESVVLELSLDMLDLLGMQGLQENSPFVKVTKLRLHDNTSKTGFIRAEFLCLKFGVLGTIFPKMKELDITNLDLGNNFYSEDLLIKSFPEIEIFKFMRNCYLTTTTFQR